MDMGDINIQSEETEKIERFEKLSIDQSGFGLVEVMIVLVVAIVLAFFLEPQIGHWRANTRTIGIARELNSALQLTKLEAIKRNQDITFRVNSAQPWSLQVFIDDGSGGGTSDNGTREGTEELILNRLAETDERSVLFQNVSFGGNPFTVITSRGVPELGRSGSATACKDKYLTGSCGTDNPRHYRVTLSATGNLKMEKSTDGSTWE